jgi:hypothetical protein
MVSPIPAADLSAVRDKFENRYHYHLNRRNMPPGTPPGSSSAASRAAVSADARVALWQRCTLQGNLAFEAGQDVRARRFYEEALSHAELMYAAAALTDDVVATRVAPSLFAISCNNIVELARRQADRETVGIYLYRNAARLISVAESAQASIDLRSRCLLHLEEASRALYRYFEEHGMWQAAQNYSGLENAAIFSVRQRTAAAS